MSGRGQSYFEEHNQRCAKYGISGNRQVYEQARAQGLKRFCTVEHVQKLGEYGYNRFDWKVCSSDIRADLERANERGYYVYELNKQVERDERELRKLKQEQRELKEGKNLGFSTAKGRDVYRLNLLREIRERERDIRELRERVLYLSR